MSYLARAKQLAAVQARPFVGFDGEPGSRIPEISAAQVHIFSSREEEELGNQFFNQKKVHAHEQQGTANTHEIRLPDQPSKPTKGSEEYRQKGLSAIEAWRTKFYCLSAVSAPVPGLNDRTWHAIFDATHVFLEAHAEAACALGWTALGLFGVHDRVGFANVAVCGALMVSGGALVERVEPEVIHFVRNGKAAGRYFRAPPSPVAVPVWDFGR